MDCVIVGGGVAGMQAAFSFRQLWPEKTVTMIEAEQEAGYFRTLLPQFMVGTLAEKKLFFWRPENDPQLHVQRGVRVVSIDRNNHRLILANNQKLEYNYLIIASGGRALVPGICRGISCGGVFPVRNLTSARAARKWLPDHPQIVILGGGLVGVKTAFHLARPELSITLVEKENQLLPQALSPLAALPLQAHLQRKNIRLILGNSIEDIQLQDGDLTAVQVAGEWLPCRTLLVAAGSTPDVEFLKDCGLLQNGELVVSPALQTRDQHIFAAGDAVTIVRGEHFTPWTWPQAVTQGKLAGMNVYASNPVSLSCLTRVNSMNLGGLSLVVLGAPVAAAQVIRYARPEAGIYRELFHIDGRIVGGALVGDITGAGVFHAMINTKERISAADEELLKPMGRALRQVCRRTARPKRMAVLV